MKADVIERQYDALWLAFAGASQRRIEMYFGNQVRIDIESRKFLG